MRRHYRSDPDTVIEDRRSVPVWGERSDRRFARLRRPLRRAETFYGSMLFQDARTSVLPYRMGEHPRYEVRLVPDPGRGARDQIVEGLGQDSWRGLDGAVEHWMREAAGVVTLCGRVGYEIVYLLGADSKAPVGFQLHLVPPGLFRRRWGRGYQYVPSSEAERRGRTVRLPSERLFVAEFTARRRRQMKRALAVLDEASGFTARSTDLAAEAMNRGLAYDFAAHRLMHEAAVARASSVLGWDTRHMADERRLEPYRTWRYIQVELFKLELRTLLLGGLNDGLEKAGSRLGWKTKVVIDGLPETSDIRQAEQDLAAGACGVDEILQRFHPWLALTSAGEPDESDARTDDN